MTAFLPTTRVDVLRGGATDTWGDETGLGGATVAARVPAAITETFQRSYLATEGRAGVVESITARLRPGTDVREGDRLVDLNGTTYQVQTVTSPQSVAGLTDVRASCIRIGAVSAP